MANTRPHRALGCRTGRPDRRGPGGDAGRCHRSRRPRAGEPRPAAAGPLHADGQQRLLGAPGGGRAADRDRRRPGPGAGVLRRQDRGRPRAGLGQTPDHHRPRASGRRAGCCAESGSSVVSPPAAHRGGAPSAWPTTTPRWALDGGGARDGHGHDKPATPGRHRRDGVPDPGVESPDAAGGGRTARRTGPRRGLDA